MAKAGLEGRISPNFGSPREFHQGAEERGRSVLRWLRCSHDAGNPDDYAARDAQENGWINDALFATGRKAYFAGS